MTGRLSEPDDLRHLLADTKALLLDFDGPVCSVFAGLPADTVASQLRDILRDGGHADLPPEVDKTDDPFDVLHYSANLAPDEADHVEAALRAHELEAIRSATPTPGAHDLIRRWHATDRPLAIVSNNSAAAVRAYLHLHGLADHLDLISARTTADPALLKPNKHLVTEAVHALDLPAAVATLVGDSITDLHAARSAGTRFVGYANKSGKGDLFTAEHADAVTSRIEDLHDAICQG